MRASSRDEIQPLATMATVHIERDTTSDGTDLVKRENVIDVMNPRATDWCRLMYSDSREPEKILVGKIINVNIND